MADQDGCKSKWGLIPIANVRDYFIYLFIYCSHGTQLFYAYSFMRVLTEGRTDPSPAPTRSLLTCCIVAASFQPTSWGSLEARAALMRGRRAPLALATCRSSSKRVQSVVFRKSLPSASGFITANYSQTYLELLLN